MFLGKRILAVVPARGGSKGVPLKNIHPLVGKPLVAYVGDIVGQLGYVDKAVVSTDHQQIAEVARAHGLAAPFLRPSEISGDRVGDLPVLVHALLEMERVDEVEYDVVLMLQPTCPLRTAEQVNATVLKLIKGNWDSVWTVSAVEPKNHPMKQLEIDSTGRMTLMAPDGQVNPTRQELGPTVIRNGASYAFTRSCLLEQQSILGERGSAVLVGDPIVSIDTLTDFERAAQLMTPPGTKHVC